MLTHKIDGALDALLACMMRLPALRDCYRPGTLERAALDDLMASLQWTDAVLFDRSALGPAHLSVDAHATGSKPSREAQATLQPWLDRRT
jgi:hypothetical protein